MKWFKTYWLYSIGRDKVVCMKPFPHIIAKLGGVMFRFVEYQFVPNLWPPNSSYEQTNIFLYACAAATIAAIIFSKGAPYRKPLYTNGKYASGAAVIDIYFEMLYNCTLQNIRHKVKPRAKGNKLVA